MVQIVKTFERLAIRNFLKQGPQIAIVLSIDYIIKKNSGSSKFALCYIWPACHAALAVHGEPLLAVLQLLLPVVQVLALAGLGVRLPALAAEGALHPPRGDVLLALLALGRQRAHQPEARVGAAHTHPAQGLGESCFQGFYSGSTRSYYN